MRHDEASVGAALFLASAFSLLRLQFHEVSVEPIQTLVPEPAIAFEPVVHRLEGCGFDPARPPLRLAPAEISPARSSTLRCLETAGRLMSNGSASSVTEVRPTQAAREWRAAWDRRGLRMCC